MSIILNSYTILYLFAEMSVSSLNCSLASLLECLEFLYRSTKGRRLSLYQINYLEESVTLLISFFKRLETKLEDDETMKIEKEKIAVLASQIEYSFWAAWIADPTKYIFIARRLEIATQINAMNQQMFRSIGPRVFDLEEYTSFMASHGQFSIQDACRAGLPRAEVFKRLLEIDHCFSRLKFLNLEHQMSEGDNFSSSSELDAVNKEHVLSLGLDESLNKLRLGICGSPSKLEMLGIVGMAGIGKTTLAKMIYQDPYVIQHFHIRAWVKIAQSHSKRDLLLQVLKCINQPRSYDLHSQTETCLEEQLYRSLKGQRYLIVVDDLWSAQAWYDLRRSCSDDSTGSRILITSRQCNVIEDLNCKMIHQMSLLDEPTSWDLLRKKVFGQHTCPPDLIDTGKHIAKKCKGLPLAIVVIAGILLTTSKKFESWKVIAESISSLVMTSKNPCQQMFGLSYKHLPAHLKSCFLYMGAFPGGGYEIESQELARLWIAEGFVIPTNLNDLEQVAEEYLKDLINKSLVLTVSKRSNGNVKTCRLHDLLLEFCIQQAREDKFLDVMKDSREGENLGGEDEMEIYEKEGEDEMEIYEKEDIDEVPQKNLSKEKNFRPCRLSFHCNTFGHIPAISQARTAFFIVRSREVPDILLYDLDFKLIAVLDMVPLRFDSFPEEQVSKLLLLKYLALTASFEIPSIVFRLPKLQTLIVNDSRITSETTAAQVLPMEFWGSINLRHMQLQVAHCLPIPDVLLVKQLVSLRTLSKVTLFSFFTLESFACIPNVTKLGVCETLEDFIAAYLWNIFFMNLVRLSHLRILKVCCLQMNKRSPRILPIPSPNSFPEHLRKLTLSRSHLPWGKMKILSKLRDLEVLKLRNYAFQGQEWETQGWGFQRLNYLLIENTDLRCWSLECDDCFPRLQKLVLKFCHLLEEVPEQIGDIPTLSCMELRYCSITAEQSVNYIQEQQEDCGHYIEVLIQTKNQFI